MAQVLHSSLRHSKAARWTAMAFVSFAMFCGYFVADVAAPLKPLFEQELGWTSTEYGLFTGAYGWFNVFLGMLVVAGIILDRFGPRFAGTLATVLMLLGGSVKWWAIWTHDLDNLVCFGTLAQVLVASLGYATFGAGLELLGITASKVIVRWFKDYEMALAMGLQVAVARLGTGLAIGSSGAIGKAFSVSTPILVGVALLAFALGAYLVYCLLDRRLDLSEPSASTSSPEEKFRLSDVFAILTNSGFWYLALLCALFYSAVFPFLKYAPDLMVQKFGVGEEMSGLVPSLLPFGTILLTPLFGNIYDRKGKGATIMVLGSILITLTHILFAVPWLTGIGVAVAAVLLLGIAFSLVPSAMWPSVPKIIPERRLGTAYALIFYIQNLVALMGVPYVIGAVLDEYCVIGKTEVTEVVDGLSRTVTKVQYDYTLPMVIFVGLGVLALFFALMLLFDDRRKGYGLELPCVKR